MEMMTLGERLKIARKHARLSQDGLGEKALCGQGVVSKIERGDQGKSAYVVQLAVACKVRPEWLAMEEGVMVEEVAYSTDPLVKRVAKAMQHMKEEERRYIVITSEALVTKCEPAPSEPKIAQQKVEQQKSAGSAPLDDTKPKIRSFGGVPRVPMVKLRSKSTVNPKLKGETE